MMPTLYKLYTIILVDRLKKEMEEKEMISENQVSFRKGIETMENIYVLNYLANRQVSKKKGKIVAMFADLKAAI